MGHTGDVEATVVACKAADEAVKVIILQLSLLNFAIIFQALYIFLNFFHVIFAHLAFIFFLVHVKL